MRDWESDITEKIHNGTKKEILGNEVFLATPHSPLPTLQPKEGPAVLPLGGWPPLTLPSLLFLSLCLSPVLLIPDSFQGNYFWTSCPPAHHFFYPSPAALLSHGGNISNKPQTIKLTHFSFAKSRFLSTKPRSKLQAHSPGIILWLTEHWWKMLEVILRAVPSQSWIWWYRLPTVSCHLWESVQAHPVSPRRFRFNRHSLMAYHMPGFFFFNMVH